MIVHMSPPPHRHQALPHLFVHLQALFQVHHHLHCLHHAQKHVVVAVALVHVLHHLVPQQQAY